jgi:hypothetical protein
MFAAFSKYSHHYVVKGSTPIWKCLKTVKLGVYQTAATCYMCGKVKSGQALRVPGG